MQNLFAYGTLMCEEIMEEVSWSRLPFISGKLQGFARRKVKGEHYPAIIPSDQREVAGIVYLDVLPSAWQRLDRFEGEMYVRRSVQIEFDFGTLLPAETYVLKPEYSNVLETFDWDYQTFLLFEKGAFRKHYRGYRRVDSTRS